jgi:Cu(I)/Ag(I) efflux system membrane fusion protein
MLNRKLVWTLGAPLLVIGIVIAVIAMWPERATKEIAEGEWTCSMHPQIRRDKPGQCPICGMNLIPVSQLSEVSETEKRAGIETEPVQYRELFKEVRTVGKLDYNERRIAYIAARVAGRVDRIYADFTGMQVKEGDHLVDIYSPDLVVAQSELLRSLEANEKARGDRSFAEANLEAVRTKLRLLGILPEQLAEIERTRKTSTHLTIYAPLGGTVIEKNVRAGQYVNAGDMLYRIADLDPIWLYLDIYEYDVPWVRFGQPVEVTLEAYPAETFRGVVTFIDPFLDDKTRTIKARVNLKNADRKLKPAMYASALIRVGLLADGTPEPTGMEGKYICPMHPEIVRDKPGRCPICDMQLEQVPEVRRPTAAAHEKLKDQKQDGDHKDHAQMEQEEGKKSAGVLAIRSTAVLDTGRRKVTYRKRNDGAFELVELQLGPLADGKDDAGQLISYFPVLKGLKEGDRVVIRGGFLLDSQQQISGMPSLLYEQGQSAANLHSGHGGGPAAAPPSTSSGHKH